MQKNLKTTIKICSLSFLVLSGSIFAAYRISYADSVPPLDPFTVSGTTILPRITANSFQINSLGGSGTKCLQVDNNGLFSTANSSCGSGGGSGGGTFSTTTSQVPGHLINFPNNNTDVVSIGSNASSTAAVWFDPNILVNYFKGNLGIGTTSPYSLLSVAGQIVGQFFTATSTKIASQFPYASTTMISATTASTSVLYDSFLGTPAGAFLAVNPQGQVISTTTPSSGGITSIIGGQGIAGGSCSGPTCTISLSVPESVTVGGTGVQTFGQGWINSPGGISALSASTSPTVNYLTSTSTTAINNFAGRVMIGSALFNGTFSPSGFFNTTGNPQLQISSNTSDAITLLTVGNTDISPFGSGCISLANANTPSSGGANATYNSNICFQGPNFAAYPGAPANSLAIDNTDGSIVTASLSSNYASSTQAWAVGPGFTAANYDMQLSNLNPSLYPNSTGSAVLSLGSTTPYSDFTIVASSTKGLPFFTIASSTNGTNSTVGTVKQQNVFQITNTGIASTTNLTISNITGTQCLHTTGNGVVDGTGSDCGSSGGSGIVNTGIIGQTAYYQSSGTAVNGTSTSFINPDGSFGVYRGNASSTDIGQNITARVNGGIFTALDIRNNLSGGGSKTGEAINLSNIATSTSLIPQSQISAVDDGDFSQNIFLRTKVQGSFTNALQTSLEVKSNNCVIGNASGLTIQNVTGGDQVNDINTTSACSANQLMIDGSQGQAAVYYAVNSGTGTATQVPFNFWSGITSMGAIPSQVLGSGGSSLHNTEINFNTSASTMKQVGDSSVATTNYSGSAKNSGSSFCNNTVALLNGYNATTTKEGVDNSDCFIWVPNFTILSDDAANAGIIVNASKQYMNGVIIATPGGSSNSGLDTDNYAMLDADFTSRSIRIPKWVLDVPTPEDKVYRFTVSGITTSPSNQAMYNVNGIPGAGGTNYEESAENITGGTGTIDMTGTTTPASSGTLTLDSQTGTGDATISYSAVTFLRGWQDAFSVDPGSGLTMASTTLFTNATTTNLAITGLATPAGAFLAVDPSGNVIATTTPSGGGSSGTVTSITLATPNSTLALSGTNPVTTSGTINLDFNLNHSNWWTALQNFTNASTSQFTSTSTTYLASVNGNVAVGATSTPGTLFSISNIANFANGTSTVYTDTAIGTSSPGTIPQFVCNYGNCGTGSSTPDSAMSITAASSTSNFNPISDIWSTIAGVAYAFQEIDSWGHIITSGPQPVLSGCGTSPSFIGAANDQAMKVQVGSVSATGCVITFAHAYASAPEVNVTEETGSVTNSFGYSDTASAITVSQIGLTGDILDITVKGTR